MTTTLKTKNAKKQKIRGLQALVSTTTVEKHL